MMRPAGAVSHGAEGAGRHTGRHSPRWLAALPGVPERRLRREVFRPSVERLHLTPPKDNPLEFAQQFVDADRENLRMDNRLKEKTNDHGLINLIYAVDQGLLNAIGGAKSVGVELQPAAAAAIFSRFNFMPFEDGAAKPPRFLGRVSSRWSIDNPPAFGAPAT